MREVDFRGKLKKQEDIDLFGEWFYGDLIHYADGSVHIRQIETGTTLEVHPVTVGQFTGMKDGIGTKIYDGDILYSVLDDETDPRGYVEIYNKVCFMDGSFGEIGENTGDFHSFSLLGIDGLDDSAVISNIHDNPDLIIEIKK